jgi:D-amino-acid dehydrogenase
MTDVETAPDVLVVGAGAVGVSIAYELAQRGLSTVLAEVGDHVAAGCSAGNAGLVCPSHSAPLATAKAVKDGLRWMFNSASPFYLRPRPAVLPWITKFMLAARASKVSAATQALLDLSVASLWLHREWVDAGVQTGYHTAGILDVFETEAGYAGATARAARRSIEGLTTQTLSGDEARGMVPGLSPSIVGAQYFAQEGHCDGREFVEAVAKAAIEHGAHVATGAGVSSLQLRDGRIESASVGGQRVTPGTVVLAAGAWSRRLAADVRVRIPLEAGKGYHIDVPRTESDPSVPVFMSEARVIATPLEGRIRMSGTLELSGMDDSINQRRADAVRASCERLLAGLAGRPILETWSGLRPCSPDGIPIVGMSGRVPNLMLATGHAMMGLANAPITGRLVAQLIAGEPTALNVEPLSPRRFRGC